MLLKSFYFSVKGRVTETSTPTLVSRGLKPLDIKFKNWWPELARQLQNTRRAIVPISSPADNTHVAVLTKNYAKLVQNGGVFQL